nr:VP2d protein [Blotched snakehead virus]
ASGTFSKRIPLA